MSCSSRCCACSDRRGRACSGRRFRGGALQFPTFVVESLGAKVLHGHVIHSFGRPVVGDTVRWRIGGPFTMAGL